MASSTLRVIISVLQLISRLSEQLRGSESALAASRSPKTYHHQLRLSSQRWRIRTQRGRLFNNVVALTYDPQQLLQIIQDARVLRTSAWLREVVEVPNFKELDSQLGAQLGVRAAQLLHLLSQAEEILVNVLTRVENSIRSEVSSVKAFKTVTGDTRLMC